MGEEQRSGGTTASPGPPGPAAQSARPDRDRWNARYGGGFKPSFAPHRLVLQALSLGIPDGPVADLACGPSGSALLAASAGREVTAVDVSDVALRLLGQEAARLGLADMITLVEADLTSWRPPEKSYSLVLCTGYWDRALYPPAAQAVLPGGLLGWESFTDAARQVRPGLCAGWCLGPGEPASLLPPGFEVLNELDLPDDEHGDKRRLLARRGSD